MKPLNHPLSRRNALKTLALLGSAALLRPVASAQTTAPRPSLPTVQPLGANQPLAPGYRDPAALPQLELGPFSDRDVPAYVTAGEMETSLLGMDYLGQFDIGIGQGQLTLSR